MQRLAYVGDRLRGSFWFVPTLCAVLAVALAGGLLLVDRRVQDDLPTTLWFYTGGAEGARSLLSALAGSIITVLGLAFSITTVALQLAAAQLGPRLLRNFVRDPGNQVVLGTLVGTFVYCLIVLREIRGTNGLVNEAFVPHVSVTGAVGLAMLSVGVLIYFIHHAAVSMQADHVIEAVMHEMHRTIAAAFPELMREGEEPATHPAASQPPPGRVTIVSPGSGYVQSIDASRLVKLAAERDIVIRLPIRPGDFVAEGDAIAEAWPPAHVDVATHAVLVGNVVLGIQRTMLQDVLFGFEQLVEIAANALSSSLRDPITACRCVDRLGEAVEHIARRRTPSFVRHEDNGGVRLTAPAPSLEEVVGAAFDVLRTHARLSPLVNARMLKTCERLVKKHHRRDLHAAVFQQALAIRRAADALDDPLDREAMRGRWDEFLRHVRPDVVAQHADPVVTQVSAA